MNNQLQNMKAELSSDLANTWEKNIYGKDNQTVKQVQKVNDPSKRRNSLIEKDP